MSYANNNLKFIAILNHKIEIPRLLNALGHMTAGLVSQAVNHDKMSFLQYQFHENLLTPATISLYPFIILKAKNSNQLKTVHESASHQGMLHNIFTESMLGNSASEQVNATKNTKSDDLNYFGITLFGDSQKLTELTRKFSLFSI